MAQKVKMDCPRCDGKGVIPQYFYNRKGICFLCWGSGSIMVKVPAGKDKEEYAKELAEKERQFLKNNPPKVAMPDAKKHRNKDYFKDTKTKLKPRPEDEAKKKEVLARLEKLYDRAEDGVSVAEWKAILKDVEALPHYDDKQVDIRAIKNWLAEAEEEEAKKKKKPTLEELKKGLELTYKNFNLEQLKAMKVTADDNYKKAPDNLIMRATKEVIDELIDKLDTDVDEKAIRDRIRKMYGNLPLNALKNAQKDMEDNYKNHKGFKAIKKAGIELQELNKIIAEKEKPIIDDAEKEAYRKSMKNHTDYAIGEYFKSHQESILQYHKDIQDAKKWIAEGKNVDFNKRKLFNSEEALAKTIMRTEVLAEEGKKRGISLKPEGKEKEARDEFAKKYAGSTVEQLEEAIEEMELWFDREDMAGRIALTHKTREAKLMILEQQTGLTRFDPDSVGGASPAGTGTGGSGDDTGSERIGKVVKAKGKPDIEIVSVAGNLNVGKFVNSKTGKDQYTVFPEDKIEDWNKFKKDIKDNVGGIYSMFLRKPIFDENPTEKLKAFVAGKGADDYGTKGATGGTDTGGNTGGTTGDDDDDEASKKRAERRRQRELRRKADEIYMNNTDYTVAGWTKVREQIEAMEDFDDKAQALQDVDNRIKEAKEREVSDNNKKAVQAILDSHPEMMKATVEQLDDLLADLKANVPDSKEKTEAIDRIEYWKKIAVANEEKQKKRTEAQKKYADEVLKPRQDIVDKGVTYKDTDLGKKVASLAGNKAVSDKETAIKVGAELRKEMLKRLDAKRPEGMAELEARIRELRKKPRQEVHDELRPLEKEYSDKWYDYQREMVDSRKEVVMDMMNEIRDMGGKPVETIHLKGDSNKTIKKRVAEASKYFPTEWVEMSNTQPIRVKNEPKRAYHMGEQPPNIINGEPNYGLLGLGAKESETTIVHELGHRMEMVNSRLQSVIFDYLETHTEGQKQANIYSWTNQEKYKPKKNGTPWVNNYIGKDYFGRDGKRRATEVLTMGLECLYFNTHKGTGYSSADTEDREKYNAEHYDEEFMNLILGVLAGA